MRAMRARDDFFDAEELTPSRLDVVRVVEHIRIVYGPIQMGEHEACAELATRQELFVYHRNKIIGTGC